LQKAVPQYCGAAFILYQNVQRGPAIALAIIISIKNKEARELKVLTLKFIFPSLEERGRGEV
jgi:hypothetical protein